jgi:hypothetical protein
VPPLPKKDAEHTGRNVHFLPFNLTWRSIENLLETDLTMVFESDRPCCPTMRKPFWT